MLSLTYTSSEKYDKISKHQTVCPVEYFIYPPKIVSSTFTLTGVSGFANNSYWVNLTAISTLGTVISQTTATIAICTVSSDIKPISFNSLRMCTDVFCSHRNLALNDHEWPHLAVFSWINLYHFGDENDETHVGDTFEPNDQTVPPDENTTQQKQAECNQ